ncbi:DNA-binding transcriptional regulator YciT [Aeromonas schubertii]|uniref:DeoR/GlpR family DNA-binding transcription regulator n=1 Tax=Aeromonas schubertii TaxID=652 RepID=A0A0S2SMN1_9GAMM|nr:DNA-binding transcriptional regulator YciT [Aeromonas schubertii]ALP42903.1 putative HTH-type transcriptional regulator YciT [Aeromonas schubertii]KUE81712.1 DeoR family transcriptional regulator [Aeromonas schubertii]MBZ6065139.1 DeoR/GlpR family DNA-binding transcription regulator [Aeromonas schubertii]MBZ6071606.1 DeoR/GlpR family DNA-binding transcription regulator [Aeromonas schubertii]
MNPRHQQILTLVHQARKMSVAELARHTGVSEVTIRGDLNALEKLGLLRRVHGFAVATETDALDARISINYPLKERLAERAAQLVEEGETVFIEGGSANALLARHLARRKRVTIITVSSYIAHLLKETDAQVILLGGLYQHESESVVGPLTRVCIEQVHFARAFVGVDGFQRESGFTSRDAMRCEVVNAVLAKGVENIVITDSSKFGAIQPYRLDAGPIARVVTDDALPQAMRHELAAQGTILSLVTA